MYDKITPQLREAYDRGAAWREQRGKDNWKIEERQAFLERLQAEKKTTLLEIGAGTGTDGKYFQDNGLKVICTDLSPEMIAYCHAKGLEAYLMDFLNLDFPENHFDAVYGLNCLLHVPKETLPDVLQAIRRVLKVDGLFFMSLYGGINSEGVYEDDKHEPKRFFSFHTDEDIQKAATCFFSLEQFKSIAVGGQVTELHNQLLILRKQIS